MKRSNNKGFTIVELMIASSTFSVMLLVCLGAVIYLGRLYYKGVTISSTIDTTDTAMENVIESIQYSENTFPVAASGGWQGYCMDNKKFSYRTGTQLVTNSPGSGQSDQVLIISTDPGCNPSTSNAEPVNSSDRRELLKENMRLTSFRVTSSGSGLYDIEIGVAYGGDPTDSLVEQNTFNTDGSGNIVSCKDSSQATAFCAVTYLTASVGKKVN